MKKEKILLALLAILYFADSIVNVISNLI